MNRSAPIAVLLACGLLAASGAALADKPDWSGGKPGKHGKQEERGDRQDDRRNGAAVEFRFSDKDRRVLADYYGGQARAGHCPPGLAKKNNGCMPPGQAKKWRKGYPLPGDVRYYELSNDILVRLPPPPRGHRYVQVAGDILMIAIGTSMVVDAVEDLLR